MSDSFTHSLQRRLAEWDWEFGLEDSDLQRVKDHLQKIAAEEQTKPSDEQFEKWRHRQSTHDLNQEEMPGFDSPEIFNALVLEAERNRAWAQKLVSLAHADSKHPEFNPSEALRWSAKAASHGYPEFVDKIMHSVLRAVYQRAEEIKRYREAAENGYAEFQHQLGYIYYQGQGVDVDKDLAVYWWGKASEKGHERASQMLEQIRDLSDEED